MASRRGVNNPHRRMALRCTSLFRAVADAREACGDDRCLLAVEPLWAEPRGSSGAVRLLVHATGSPSLRPEEALRAREFAAVPRSKDVLCFEEAGRSARQGGLCAPHVAKKTCPGMHGPRSCQQYQSGCRSAHTFPRARAPSRVVAFQVRPRLSSAFGVRLCQRVCASLWP